MAKDDGARFHSVDAGRACPTVAPHPVPRHHEEGGVRDEVVQVTEPTVRAVGRPLVQLGLHTQYLGFGLFEARPRIVGFHRRAPAIAVALLLVCWPLRHVGGFPAPGLLRALRPTPGPSADSGPARHRTGSAWGGAVPGRFPRSPSTGWQGWRPALPLQPRNEYAAGFPRGLLVA